MERRNTNPQKRSPTGLNSTLFLLFRLEMAETQNSVSARLVLTSSPVPRVRVLSLNRPEKRNALSQDLIQQLLDELSSAAADPGTGAVVITGNESVFSGMWRHCFHLFPLPTFSVH